MKLTTTLFTILFSCFVTTLCAQTSPTIAELEQQKVKATQEQNFKLAGELKLKIQELKDKEQAAPTIAELEQQKIKATQEENFKLAGELKLKIQELKDKEQAAEDERKRAEVEEFKKEIEESVRKKKEEEAAKIAAEQGQKEAAQAKLANEAKLKAEQQALIKEKQEAEQKRKAEELAILKEKQAAEQKLKAEQQALLKEKLAAEQKQKAAEQALLKEKLAAEQKQRNEELAAQQKQKAEELALLKEKQAAEQKQKAEELAIQKAKLDEELKQRAEEQLLEKEIALAEQNVKKETDIEVKAIESQIAKAVASENYLLAEELKGKIKATKEAGDIKLANVATDIKRKREEKKAQEALEKENAEKQRLQLAAELERKRENAKTIESLEKEKAKAVADANFILAEELKVKINALKENKEVSAPSKISVNNATESELEKLEKAKAKAVAESDFKLAEELKVKINSLKNNSTSSNASASSKTVETNSTNSEVEALEKQKAKAVADGDFKLAGELKNKIANLKANAEKNAALNAQINELEKQKAKAVADADYKLAGELNTKIKNLKNPPETKIASNNTNSSQTNLKGNNSSLKTTSSNLNQNNTQGTAPSKIENASLRVSRSSENESTGIKYRRSSLYTLMVNNTSRERSDVIKDAFIKSPLPANFNDHNLTIATVDVTSNSNASNLVNNLNSYFQTNKIAKDLVAKWFNRNEKGCFNMDLIKERGEYNATNIDLNLAKSSTRGLALLADAGEELIANTYVVINDFRFTNKEDVANKTKAGLGLLSAVSTLAGGPDLSAATTIASAGATVAGKGYVVRNTSYLFQLVWNPEVAATFYQDYWMDESNYSESRKQAFDESNLFTLKYVGTESGLADLQSTIFTNKTEDELIYKATSRAVDNGIAKLQRKFEQFRIKTPIYSVNPITAKIGLKEDIKAGDRFEVLEQVMDENGKLSYRRKGIITVDGRNIWDNTNTIQELEEAGKNTNVNQYTIFKGTGDYAPGMLIRQIN